MGVISWRHYQRFESGEEDPRLTVAIGLALIFDVELQELASAAVLSPDQRAYLTQAERRHPGRRVSKEKSSAAEKRIRDFFGRRRPASWTKHAKRRG